MRWIIQLIRSKVPRKYWGIVWIYYAKLRVLSIFYWGKRVQCPICEQRFRKFIPFGNRFKHRANALCPHCLALERHRLLWLYLQKKTNFFQAPLKVLHVAPEICFIPRFRKLPNLDYVTADLESSLAAVKMDLHAIPFSPESFDVVLCSHVLEHVKDDQQCMQEIYNVLKPHGWAILQVPIDWSLDKTYEDPSITSPIEREKAFGQKDHLRQYGKDYLDRLAKAGFHVKLDDFLQTLAPTLISRFALPRDEKLVVCMK